MKLTQTATLLGSALVLATMSAVPAMASLTVTIADNAGSQTFTVTTCPSSGKYKGSSCSSNLDQLDLNDAYFGTGSGKTSAPIVTVATSFSPNGVMGLTLTVSANARKAGFLDITVSDNGFTTPLGKSTALFQGGPTGTSVTGGPAGPLTGTGYFVPSNTICSSTSSCSGTQVGTLTFPNYQASSGSATAGVTPTGAYALDELITADFSKAGIGNFGFTLNLTPAATPEPASILLFGGLAGAAVLALRRRRAA